MASLSGQTTTDTPIVSCCTAFYELDWVRQLAQESFHPGGADLTRRMIRLMDLSTGAKIADVGCGAGTSARLLAGEFGFEVCALDLGINGLAAAETANKIRSDSHEDVCFILANAMHLPFSRHAFQAVLAECSFSLVRDQVAALKEFRRVLCRGGQLGISDMAIAGELSADISEVLAPWTCLSDARSQAEYECLFESAGFTLREAADESEGLLKMLTQLKRKLLLLATGAAFGGIEIPNLDLERVRYWMGRFREEVLAGRIRYLRFNLQKPQES